MKNDVKVEYGESFIRVGKPVVDGFIKASSKSVNLPCAPVDGDVLISLEVNGTVVARRELFTMVEGSVDVGDYTVAYSGGAVTISTTANNDVVEIRIEPVEVVVSDAFRVAVGEAAPEAPSGLPAITGTDDGKVLTANSGEWVAQTPASGGGVFAVNLSATNESGSWVATSDKTYAEIDSAYKSGQIVLSTVTVRNYVMGEYARTVSMTGALVADLDDVGGNIYTICAQYADAEANNIYAYNIFIDAEGNEVYITEWTMNRL